MSYITEIWLDFKLNKNTPDLIIYLLKNYINNSFKGWMPLSNHPFFRLKDGEIDQFIDWLKAHIKGRKKQQYLGWYKRDGDKQQTNIYLER